VEPIARVQFPAPAPLILSRLAAKARLLFLARQPSHRFDHTVLGHLRDVQAHILDGLQHASADVEAGRKLAIKRSSNAAGTSPRRRSPRGGRRAHQNPVVAQTAYANIFSMFEDSPTMNNMGSKVAGTVVAFFGWFAFIVLYLAFYAPNFNFWQSLAVFIASGAIVIAIIAALWIKWAMH
jgi:hypothetical protein